MKFVQTAKRCKSQKVLNTHIHTTATRTTTKQQKIFQQNHKQNMTNIPMTVIEGFSLPSLENMQGMTNLAKGLLGLGSLGVPSTRDHTPIVLCQPTML